MNPHEKSIEEKNKENKIISQWEHTDVLYSFIGIYQIGLLVFYSDEFRSTGYTIKAKTGEYASLKHLTAKENDQERFKNYKDLNMVIKEAEFIQYIDSPGNVIPMWPGGNMNRGISAYCFDIPDIYFKRYERWFSALIREYPNSCLDGIIDNNEFSTAETRDFLNMMNKASYRRFLDHVVKIIKVRNECLRQTA